MNDKSSNNSDDYFEFIFEDRPLKYIGVVTSCILMSIICCLCCGIIWFERFGSDQKRILMNKLVSAFCRAVLCSFFLAIMPDLVLYFYRPYPVWLCYIIVIGRHIIVVHLFLLLEAIIVARYACIFWLKDPLSFDDKFWCLFVNICILAFGVLSQTIFIVMPGRQPLQFYLCSNHLTLEIANSPGKFNWLTILLFIKSLFAHMFTSFKIGQLKNRQKSSVLPLTHPDQARFDCITIIEKQSLADFVTNLFTIFCAGVLLGSVYVMNLPNPLSFSQDPNYLLVYFQHFVLPPLLCGPVIVSLYVRNPMMRTSIARELQCFFRPRLDNIHNAGARLKKLILKCFASDHR